MSSVANSSTAHVLPVGARVMQARHVAFEQELDSLIKDLPLHGMERVLDAPCGDGRQCGPPNWREALAAAWAVVP